MKMAILYFWSFYQENNKDILLSFSKRKKFLSDSMNLQESKPQQLAKGPSEEEIKEKWKKLVPIYVQFDSTPQTFFYTLANMLKLEEAKNILEIACGSGKLIPHVLDLKPEETFYYATDISQEMIDFAKARLEKHFKKYESRLTFDEWMQKQNLEFDVVNGEEKLPKEIKFDRIICNLVLMLATDPRKMLENLYNHAEEGCLMGLTVWGDRKKTNIFQFIEDLSSQKKILPQNYLSPFHLSQDIESLVEQCGWSKVLSWEQSVVFPVIEHSYECMHPFVEKQILARFPKYLHSTVIEKIDQWINKEKCGLNFTGKVMIVKKRTN